MRKIRTFDLLFFQLTNTQKIATSLFAGGCAGNYVKHTFRFNRIIFRCGRENNNCTIGSSED